MAHLFNVKSTNFVRTRFLILALLLRTDLPHLRKGNLAHSNSKSYEQLRQHYQSFTTLKKARLMPFKNMRTLSGAVILRPTSGEAVSLRCSEFGGPYKLSHTVAP